MNPIEEKIKDEDKLEKREKKDEKFEKDTIEQVKRLPTIKNFTEAVELYIKRGYQSINPMLRMTKGIDLSDVEREAKALARNDPALARNWKIPETISTIEDLDQGFKTFKTTSDITVFRRAGGNALGYPISDKGNPVKDALNKFDKPESQEWLLKNVIEKFPIGSTFSDRAYLSTSFSDNYTGSSFQNHPVHFEIFVPEGTRGLTISSRLFTGFSNEKEFLLDRGYDMQVKDIKISTIDGQRKIFIKVEVIPNNDHNKR